MLPKSFDRIYKSHRARADLCRGYSAGWGYFRVVQSDGHIYTEEAEVGDFT